MSKIVEQERAEVIVLGSSITAWMAAGWLAHKEGLDVLVIGPEVGQEKRPIVGESTVEPAVLFFRELGMGDALDGEHALKYGLTFYHKLRPDDPSDTRYSVHAPERHLHHLSRQLHRPRFDCDLATHAMRGGARFLKGRVLDYEARPEQAQRHVVQVQTEEGVREVSGRYIIDATGRTRFLGKRVTTYTRPTEEGQRCSFWFRLADFKPFTDQITSFYRRPLEYDVWSSTHHFMGHGNWIWGIPLKDPEGHPLISVGITWHPKHFGAPIQNLAGFLAYCDQTHPALAAMVRSGEVLDTQLYMNYLYWADQVYDKSGWFLLGDSARAVDPLYSTGLSMTSVQVLQTATMIRRDREGRLSEGDVTALQKMLNRVAERRQQDITDQYATMGDPWIAHLRRYWNLNAWFNGFLPLWFNGYVSTPEAAEVIERFSRDESADAQAFFELLMMVSRRLGPPSPEDLDASLDFDRIIDRQFDCPAEDVPAHVARMLRVRGLMRLRMLWLAGGEDAPRQLRIAMEDLGRSAAAARVLPKAGAEAFKQLQRPFRDPGDPSPPRPAWRDLALLLDPREADRLRSGALGKLLGAVRG